RPADHALRRPAAAYRRHRLRDVRHAPAKARKPVSSGGEQLQRLLLQPDQPALHALGDLAAIAAHAEALDDFGYFLRAVPVGRRRLTVKSLNLQCRPTLGFHPRLHWTTWIVGAKLNAVRLDRVERLVRNWREAHAA